MPGTAVRDTGTYSLGNFLRTLAALEAIKDWSLTSLKKTLIKIDAKMVSHWLRSPSRGKFSRRYFGRSRNYGRSRHLRQRETHNGHAFKSNRQEKWVRMPRKMPSLAPQPPLGYPTRSSRPRLAPVLQEGRKTVSIYGSS